MLREQAERQLREDRAIAERDMQFLKDTLREQKRYFEEHRQGEREIRDRLRDEVREREEEREAERRERKALEERLNALASEMQAAKLREEALTKQVGLVKSDALAQAVEKGQRLTVETDANDALTAGVFQAKSQAAVQPAAQGAINWLTEQNQGRTQTVQQPTTQTAGLNIKVPAFAPSATASTTSTPAPNKATNKFAQYGKQPLMSTQTDNFAQATFAPPSMSDLFTHSVNQSDGQPMTSPLGELPENEQDLRDRGILVNRNSASRRRGYTIYPKPFTGEDFLAFHATFENLIKINEWDYKTATGHLVYCFSQGPAQVILASRPNYKWQYDELMNEGMQMFGQTISEAQMRMQLRKISRKPDETLPKLVTRIMAITKRAVSVPEAIRGGAECEAFLSAISDNRPLYFYINRTKDEGMRIAKMLKIAMEYVNEEGASDDWVNELVQKELAKQGIKLKTENSTDKSTSSVNSDCKPAESTGVNAFAFNERNKPKDWEEGYQQIARRLNEDLNLKNQENVDRKIQNQKFIDALESVQKNLKEQADNLREMNKHQNNHFNQWSGNSGGFQGNNNYQGGSNQGFRRPWNNGPRGRGGRGGFNNRGRGRGNWTPRGQSFTRFNWIRTDPEGNVTDVLDDDGNNDWENYWNGGYEEEAPPAATPAPSQPKTEPTSTPTDVKE